MLTISLNAQVFGGFKPSKQWSQLNNENYRIIYSPDIDSIARKTAAIFSTMNALQNNIGAKRRNINIVLQNSTTRANGYVGLAPYISEFFLTPLPNNAEIGTLPWHYTLAIHEYQHVLQFANSYYGVSKIAHWLAGESGWSAAQFLSIPNWFFEGNAVMAETDFTEQGRARIPSFFNEFRAFTQQGQFPSYDKLRNGSIQDLLPDQYPLGYLMVSYGREKYGQGYWTNVLREASAYRGVIYPFSRALKKEGGEYSNRYYKSMIADLRARWETKQTVLGSFLYKTKKQEVVIYEFPTFDLDGSLYFHKASFDKAGAIYQLKGKQLIKHQLRGIRSNNYFDVHQGNILSTQTRFDKRWGWIDYEDIVIYNTQSKKLLQLTDNGKYFHPTFSKDGKKILALFVAPQSTYELHLLSSNTGELIQKIKNPDQYYFTYMSSTSTGSFISSVRNNIGQMAIIEIMPDGEFNQLTDWTYHILGRVSELNGSYYFNASYDGTDNLYKLQNGRIDQISKDGSGRYSPVVNPKGDSLFFTAFNLNGYHLKATETSILKEEELTHILPLDSLPFYNREYMKSAPKISTKKSLKDLKSKPYSKHKKLVNLHSWGISTNDPEYGIELNSDNILNTLDLSAGYLYNTNEERGAFQLSLDYGQYFVHFNASVEKAERNIRTSDISSIQLSETNWQAGISLPLNYSAKTFSRFLNLSANYEQIYANFNNEQFNDLNISANNFSAIYRQSKIRARKNIFTHFGIYSEAIERIALNENTRQFSFKNSLALRGIFSNHNIIIDADAQIDGGDGRYRFSDRFNYSRGFRDIRFRELYKFSANYHFPIAYPDKGTIGLVYVQRIRSNLFFDYSHATAIGDFSSTGAEVIFDLRFFRLVPLSLGVRYSQVLSQKAFSQNENQQNVEVFIPINRF